LNPNAGVGFSENMKRWQWSLKIKEF
jgi:hypothetical protein